MRTEQFDKWLSENIYPALAGLCPGLIDYRENMTEPVAARYRELCEGKPENRFDTVLRERYIRFWRGCNVCRDQVIYNDAEQIMLTRR